MSQAVSKKGKGSFNLEGLEFKITIPCISLWVKLRQASYCNSPAKASKPDNAMNLAIAVL